MKKHQKVFFSKKNFVERKADMSARTAKLKANWKCHAKTLSVKTNLISTRLSFTSKDVIPSLFRAILLYI